MRVKTWPGIVTTEGQQRQVMPMMCVWIIVLLPAEPRGDKITVHLYIIMTKERGAGHYSKYCMHTVGDAIFDSRDTDHHYVHMVVALGAQ